MKLDVKFIREFNLDAAAEHLCIASSVITNKEGQLLGVRMTPEEARAIVENALIDFERKVS